MAWNYNGISTISPVQPTVPTEHAYSAEQSAMLQALIARPENATIASTVLHEATSLGLRNNVQDGQRLMGMIDRAFGGVVYPVGNDAMVTSPSTFTIANALGEQQLLEQSGRTSTNQRDVELMASRVENLVKGLMARGASREEIQREARGLASTPALADLASEMSAKQYDSNRNPLADIAPRIAPVLAAATLETAAPGDSRLQNMLVGNVANRDLLREEDLRRRLNEPQRGPIPAIAMALAGVDLPLAPNSLPVVNASTTIGAVNSNNTAAALDFVLNTGPTPGLPNLKGGPGRGGQNLA